jgi:hypothetical protein
MGADRYGINRDQGYQRSQAQTGDAIGAQRQAWNSDTANRDLASDNLQSNQQSWDREAQLSKDLLSKDRELTRNIASMAKEENTTDHLQTAWGTSRPTGAELQTDLSANAQRPTREVGGTDHLQAGWARSPDDRDFQTDKSANALSRDQMAEADANASYRNTMNPDKEIGGHDHLQASWDRAPDTRDFQTDKSANALSRDQMAAIDKNASYRNSSNPGQEVGGMDHLKSQANWDNGIEKKGLQADLSSNAMRTEQLGANANTASYSNSANPQKEVGGTDHLSQGMSAGYDTQAQNRNFRS